MAAGAGEVKDCIRDEDLSEPERWFFGELRSFLRDLGLKTQLRVAGGWVRDKLLGLTSKDIDIAIDNMMGDELATRLRKYLEDHGEATGAHHKIQRNPEQSKHLETATMKMRGMEVDFVNLRAEKYAEGSRIPTMDFGTAKEDAMRRDLTINSLFYNIESREVEDLTQRGIQDLKAGLVRTPLPAEQTFLDDPLRVLRAVRFAARYGFAIDGEIVDAARLGSVREALASKVSRERVGIEVSKMLTERDPVGAMRHLSDMRLYTTVFAAPPTAGAPLDEAQFGSASLAALAEVAEVADLCRADTSQALPEDPMPLLLAALLLPVRSLSCGAKKGKQVPLSSHIILQSLKLKNEYAVAVATLHAAAEEFQQLARQLAPGGWLAGGDDPDGLSPEARQRVVVGSLIRRTGALWRPALVLSSALPEAAPDGAPPPGGGAAAGGDPSPLREGGPDAGAGGGGGHGRGPNKRRRAQSRAEMCRQVQVAVERMGLDRAWELRPLVDGNVLKETLQLKDGPLVKRWLSIAMEWQLANPGGTREDCQAWLLAQSRSES